MPRHFRLEEAERLLPQLEPFLREAVALKQRFDQAQAEWRQAAGRLMMLGGADLDRSKLLAQRSRRDALAARLEELIAEIQQHGCLVKDLQLGLLDFPAWFRGREVLLCWQLGEPAIRFWHGVEEGYRGRKLIDEDFLLHHRGDGLS